MKKVIFLPIIIMLFFINSAIAQQYYPFQTDTAKWSVTSWFHNYPGGYSHETVFFFISGDTIFDTVTYSKIYRVVPQSTYEIDTASAEYIGGLREDNQKHIYYKPAKLNQEFTIHCYIENSTLDEFLLYRFDVALGDVFELNEFIPFPVGVGGVDSVLVGTHYRRRLQIAGTQYEYWIEGIGSMTSLFGNFCPLFESGDDLWCYEDPETFFIGPMNETDRCTYFIVGQEENHSAEITLFPNPATNLIQINNPENRPVNQINFYDAMGNRVLKVDDHAINIDISMLKPGLYLLEIISEDASITRKLLIE
jgi:hypothetical protein